MVEDQLLVVVDQQTMDMLKVLFGEVIRYY